VGKVGCIVSGQKAMSRLGKLNLKRCWDSWTAGEAENKGDVEKSSLSTRKWNLYAHLRWK